jgi:mono/diheme cytochrome c family protein
MFAWLGRFLTSVLVTLLIAGCGAAAPGDRQAGRRLFNGEIPLEDQAATPCSQCHSVEPGGKSALGTNLSNIGNRAASTVPGQSAEVYLRTAIVDPDAYLAGNFQDGLMYRRYARALTPKQIEDLVAYMLTLKSGQDD